MSTVPVQVIVAPSPQVAVEVAGAAPSTVTTGLAGPPGPPGPTGPQGILAFDGLAALAAADVATANDVLAIYDLSATTHKKITVTDLLDGGTF